MPTLPSPDHGATSAKAWQTPTNTGRQWEIDALRGLMLLLMTVTHLPTRLTSPLGQPFGYVSAAEGFVLLSAYVAGLVYSRLALRKSIDAMRQAFWRRALKVYLCQAAILLFLFTVIAAVGIKVDQPAVKDLMNYYLLQPYMALAAGLVLIYQPPLLDILPLYVLFMLASPWVLAWGLRHGWQRILWISFGFWVAGQFGIGTWTYNAVASATGLHVPLEETGAFVIFSWQLLWVAGLWCGASRNAPDAKPFVFSRKVLWAAAVIAVVCLVWRHVVGQAPFGANVALNLLFDKWALGPLRVLDLIALSVVVLGYGPWLAARLPRQRWLETMGAASLPVFCAHLVIVLLVLALLGSDPLERPAWQDGLLLAVSFPLLYGVALTTAWFDKRTQAAEENSVPQAPRISSTPPTAVPVELPAPK